jgi:hypothetical protein
MGWIAIAFICVLVILIVVFNTSQRKGSGKGARKPTVATYPIRIPSRNKEIHQLLKLAYTNKQRVTMKYETGNPLPGEPAIKIRDIDIYGIGNEYLEAYCHYRTEVRTFKISRVLWVHLSEETYQIPCAYIPSTWVTEGWGEIEGSKLEPIEETSSETTNLPVSEDAQNKYERHERQQVSREAVPYGHSGEGTRTYARYDWQKHFEKSIRTPFPDEWSPALPYLYEANRLEREGAHQQKIQEVLEQARKADSEATSFYVTRWSIMKKTQNQNHERENKDKRSSANL